MIRPEVEYFANLMEEKLKKNDYKGGWKDEPPVYFKMHMHLEYYEFLSAFNSGSKDKIIDECVDLANYCMMLVDVLSLKKLGV
jgi:hypothetical protein